MMYRCSVKQHVNDREEISGRVSGRVPTWGNRPPLMKVKEKNSEQANNASARQGGVSV